MSQQVVIFVLLQTAAKANGGIESISEVILRLREHRPIVLTNRESRQVDRLRASGVEVHIVAETASFGVRQNPLRYLSSYWRYGRALRRLIRSSGARIIHANDPLAFQLSLSVAKITRGVRIALNLRDTLDPGRRQPRRRYAFYFRMADRLIFLSQEMEQQFEVLAGRSPRSYSITYSVVDPKRFFPRPLHDLPARPVVLVIGIFSPKKGQLDFLRHVAPKVIAGGAEIWFAGDFVPARDPYSASCAEAAAPLGAAVRFLGYRSDLPRLIEEARLLAIPSRHEGLMRGMIETMAIGRPVVSFAVCSARETLEQLSGGAGTVVPLGAHDAMARAILHYCSDRDAAERAGAKGAAAARRLFDPAAAVARYEQAFRAMLA